MKDKPKQEDRWRKVPRDGFILGVVIGFAVWLPVTLFTADFLAESVDSLLAGLVVAIIIVSLLSGVIYLLRRRILSELLGDISVSSQAVTDAASDAIDKWPIDKAASASSAAIAVREGAALATWFFARRTIITVILSLMGTIIALAGATLLLKQTTALELQNKKLDRQIEIMAGQGKWELLWSAHYSLDAAVRLDAAIELASNGHRLSGIHLSGDIRNERAFVHLSEKFRNPGGGFDPQYPLIPVPSRLEGALNPQALFRELPDSLTRSLDNAYLSGLEVSFDDRDETELEGFVFYRSVVSLDRQGSRDTTMVRRSTFDESMIRLQEDSVHFVDTLFRKSMVRTGFGRVEFEGVTFDGAVLSLIWGRDFIADARGYGVVVDYHGSSPTPADDEPPAGFGRCSLQNIAFIARTGEIPKGLSGIDNTLEDFLGQTISRQCSVKKLYFVEAEGAGELGKLVVIEDATDAANRWNASRP